MGEKAYLFRSVQALYVVFLLQDTLLGILSSGIALFQEDKRSVSCSALQTSPTESSFSCYHP
jgi:hypothetical protein